MNRVGEGDLIDVKLDRASYPRPWRGLLALEGRALLELFALVDGVSLPLRGLRTRSGFRHYDGRRGDDLRSCFPPEPGAVVRVI